MVFGIGEKKDKPALVGAKEKIRLAREMQQSGENAVKSGQRGKGQDDTLAVMIAIWGVACALALVLMQFSYPDKGVPFRLPDPWLDRLLLKMPPPSLVSGADANTLAVMFVRGTAFFLLAGVVPGLAKILSFVARRGEKATPIWLFWAVLAVLLTGVAVLRNL